MDKNNQPENSTPWQKFETAMRHIVTVPYSEIKAKLDAEKKVRSRKRTRKSKVRAFREANGKVRADVAPSSQSVQHKSTVSQRSEK